MGLRDLIREIYATDTSLPWNTNTATINGVSFGSIYGNASSDLSGSYNLARTDSQKADILELDRLVRNITMSKNNKISEPAGVSDRLNKVEKVLYAQYPVSFATSYAYAL